MVEVFLTVAARIRAALNARRDLILEMVALRHQLGVLARSDRRFRPGDRLFWLCWRRLWHRWKEALVRRMAAANILWGAPRIHGELLKLGIPVSERTVSRYIRDRMKAPSQSWRTFLANEFSQLAPTSTVTSSDEPGDHDVAGARLCPSVQLRSHATGSRSQCRAGGVRRLAPLTSTPASWSASCPGSRAPPHGPTPTDKTRRSRALSTLGPNSRGWR